MKEPEGDGGGFINWLSDVTALHIAAYRGDLSTVERLIRAKAYVNAVDDQGQTPLLLAVKQSRLSVAARLLKAHCNPNIGDKWDNSPLKEAGRLRDRKMYTLLKCAGATGNYPFPTGVQGPPP